MSAVALRQLTTLIAITLLIDGFHPGRTAAAAEPPVAPKADKSKDAESRKKSTELERKISQLSSPQKKRLRYFQTELKKRKGKVANDPETWFVLECRDEIIFRNVGAFSNQSGMVTKKSVVAEVQRKSYTHQAITVQGVRSAALALTEFDSRPPAEALKEIDKSRAQRFKLEPIKTFEASTFAGEKEAQAHAERLDKKNHPKSDD